MVKICWCQLVVEAENSVYCSKHFAQQLLYGFSAICQHYQQQEQQVQFFDKQILF